MNNLLFTALIIALLYYFFYYLPQQKKLNPNSTTKLTQSQFTQTEPNPTKNDEPGILNYPGPITEPKEIKELKKDKDNLLKDIQQKEKTIIGLNNSYSKLETKTKQELDNLKKQLQQKEDKIKELSGIEKTIDNLTKSIQDLNQEIN